MIEELERVEALERVLGEVGELGDADRFAHGLYLARDLVVRARAAEGRFLVRVLGAIGVPQRSLFESTEH